MPLVTVKDRFQVVIPPLVRKQIGVAVGDVLEARAQKGKIVLEPKGIVDPGITESLADFKAGRTHGPFDTAEEAIASMKQELRKRARKRRSSAR